MQPSASPAIAQRVAGTTLGVDLEREFLEHIEFYDFRNLGKLLIVPLGKKHICHRQLRQFQVELGLVDDYTEVVKYLSNYYYLDTARYTTSRSCA